MKKVELKVKPIVSIEIDVNNALTATSKIISEINNYDIQDKILLLRIRGILEVGKLSDVKFAQIEEHAKNKGAYFILRNTHDLKVKETELEIEIKDSENVEEETIKVYSEEHPSDLNTLIPQLLENLSIDKQEDEKTEIFTNRLLDGVKKVLKLK